MVKRTSAITFLTPKRMYTNKTQKLQGRLRRLPGRFLNNFTDTDTEDDHVIKGNRYRGSQKLAQKQSVTSRGINKRKRNSHNTVDDWDSLSEDDTGANKAQPKFLKREKSHDTVETKLSKHKLLPKGMNAIGSSRNREVMKAKLKKKKIIMKKKQRKTNNIPRMEDATETEDEVIPGDAMEKDDYQSMNEDSGDSSQVDEDQTQSEEEGDDGVGDSIKEGEKLFAWLISPCTVQKFFKDVWEKKPLHLVRTNSADYYSSLLSTMRIDQILRKNFVEFTKNIDVTSYTNGKRETHNPLGRATPSAVWDFYNQGCSVRMLNPQTFSPPLGVLNATLQEYFGCVVGANSYLTPADSQGFAPHYDDIEAFVLQIEGKKHWKLYPPRSKDEVLPRNSSRDYSQDELGEPVKEVILNPGELLYFPRGWIHQACTVPGNHSLHITVSCYQRNSWGDLLEELLPATISMAINDDVEYRQGLPMGYLQVMGVAHSELNTARRKEFLLRFQHLIAKLFNYAPVDAAVDQMGKHFMRDAHPPILTEDEKKHSIFGADSKIGSKSIEVGVKLTKESKIKLLRAHILRLVSETGNDGKVQVYHCVDNSVENSVAVRDVEAQMFEVSLKEAEAIELLQHVYPRYISVSQLPMKSTDQKVDLANMMWKKGLLFIEK